MPVKKYFCPCCEKMQPRKHFSCFAGAKGGKASGDRKARTSEQARKAAQARWGKKEATA